MQRYAIYYAPQPGGLAEVTARWLGWDPVQGVAVPHADAAIAAFTETPRKYGFHGTIKPPFRLAEGQTVEALMAAVAALAARLTPVTLPGLRLDTIEGFVALLPEGDTAALADLAAEVVVALDGFRAPPSDAEIARRRPDRLSERQRSLLAEWGYPYVLDQFQFHLTLTGQLPEVQAQAAMAVLEPLLAPHLPRPFALHDLVLFGEAADGRFHILHRYPLTGSSTSG